MEGRARCGVWPRNEGDKKAQPAAVTQRDAGAVAERFKTTGRSVSDFGDPKMVAVQGGVAIQRPGDEVFLGGIGVSGLRADEDEAMARIGVQAMGL